MALISFDDNKSVEKLQKALGEAVAKGKDLSSVMKPLATGLQKDIGRNFTLKGNGKYAPLSKNYAAYKSKVKPSAPILVFSGDLRDSLTTTNSDSILEWDKTSATVGTKIPYAAENQYGTSNKPARPFLAISPEYTTSILNTLGSYLTDV